MDKTRSAVALMATVLKCLKGAMVKQNVPMTTLMNLDVPYLAMMIKSKFYKKRGATFFYDVTCKLGPLDFTPYRSKSSSFE